LENESDDDDDDECMDDTKNIPNTSTNTNKKTKLNKLEIISTEAEIANNK